MFDIVYDFIENRSLLDILWVCLIPLCSIGLALREYFNDVENSYIYKTELKYYLNYDLNTNGWRFAVVYLSLIMFIVLFFQRTSDYFEARNEYYHKSAFIVGKVSNFKQIITQKNKQKIDTFNVNDKRFIIDETDLTHNIFYFDEPDNFRNDDSVKIKYVEIDSLCYILKAEKYLFQSKINNDKNILP